MTALHPPAEAIDLRYHGDQDASPGLVDLAVNVRHAPMPSWLHAALEAALQDVAHYPNIERARAAVAHRHGRNPNEVLLTAGAAEAFVLLARAMSPRHAVVIHPQFTEPEAALRAAGHQVDRVVLAPPFTLEPDLVPDTADLVFIGNPTNPTSVQHPRATLDPLVRPGRLLVVDEAFADCVPGEPESFADDAELAGVVVIRSLTKTWGLAGIRCGYVLAEQAVIERLTQAQPLWSMNSLALAACVACSSGDAIAEATRWAVELSADRTFLLTELAKLADSGVRVVPDPSASFVLVEVCSVATATAESAPSGRAADGRAVREALREAGFAVRRGDTFPGLGDEWIRVAVRDQLTSQAFVTAFAECLQVIQ